MSDNTLKGQSEYSRDALKKLLESMSSSQKLQFVSSCIERCIVSVRIFGSPSTIELSNRILVALWGQTKEGADELYSQLSVDKGFIGDDSPIPLDERIHGFGEAEVGTAMICISLGLILLKEESPNVDTILLLSSNAINLLVYSSFEWEEISSQYNMSLHYYDRNLSLIDSERKFQMIFASAVMSVSSSVDSDFLPRVLSSNIASELEQILLFISQNMP